MRIPTVPIVSLKGCPIIRPALSSTRYFKYAAIVVAGFDATAIDATRIDGDAREKMFLLLRHGETNYNLERRYQGGSQLPYLTSLGRQQVAAASKTLQKIHISHVFCSPLK